MRSRLREKRAGKRENSKKKMRWMSAVFGRQKSGEGESNKY